MLLVKRICVIEKAYRFTERITGEERKGRKGVTEREKVVGGIFLCCFLSGFVFIKTKEVVLISQVKRDLRGCL